MQDPANGLPRISLPRTPVNSPSKGRSSFSCVIMHLHTTARGEDNCVVRRPYPVGWVVSHTSRRGLRGGWSSRFGGSGGHLDGLRIHLRVPLRADGDGRVSHSARGFLRADRTGGVLHICRRDRGKDSGIGGPSARERGSRGHPRYYVHSHPSGVRAFRCCYDASEGVAALVRGRVYRKLADGDSLGTSLGSNRVRSSVAGAGVRAFLAEGGGSRAALTCELNFLERRQHEVRSTTRMRRSGKPPICCARMSPWILTCVGRSRP